MKVFCLVRFPVPTVVVVVAVLPVVAAATKVRCNAKEPDSYSPSLPPSLRYIAKPGNLTVLALSFECGPLALGEGRG